MPPGTTAASGRPPAGRATNRTGPLTAIPRRASSTPATTRLSCTPRTMTTSSASSRARRRGAPLDERQVPRGTCSETRRSRCSDRVDRGAPVGHADPVPLSGTARWRGRLQVDRRRPQLGASDLVPQWRRERRRHREIAARRRSTQVSSTTAGAPRQPVCTRRQTGGPTGSYSRAPIGHQARRLGQARDRGEGRARLRELLHEEERQHDRRARANEQRRAGLDEAARELPGTPETRSWHLLLGVDPLNEKHVFANDAYPALREQGQRRRPGPSAETIGDDWVRHQLRFGRRRARDCRPRSLPIRAQAEDVEVEEGNLQVTLFYDITPDPNDPEIVYGVSQDHPFAMKFSGTLEWAYMPKGGETGKVVVDPTSRAGSTSRTRSTRRTSWHARRTPARPGRRSSTRRSSLRATTTSPTRPRGRSRSTRRSPRTS